MATPLVVFIRQAWEIGVELSRHTDGTLAIRTTKAADTVARALRSRDAEVLQLFDWTRARVEDPQPCLLCGQPAILRDPVEHRPAHKVCVDALIRVPTEPRKGHQ